MDASAQIGIDAFDVSQPREAVSEIPDARIETKFIGPEIVASHIRGWLQSHSLLFEKAYPDRWNNNIYFDTPNLDAYEENLAGITQRTKLRYRWYGDLKDSRNGYFEIKKKRNNFGFKLRYPIRVDVDIMEMNWDAVVMLLRRYLPEEAGIVLLQNPLAILMNRYRREYFESADGEVRVTVDTDLHTWDQRYSARPNRRQSSILMPRQVIVELKFALGERERVTKVLGGMPLRMSRCSKYVNGVRSVFQY